jgi:hypothetical protein
MKVLVQFKVILLMTLMCAGCATLNPPPATYHVNAQSSIELAAYFEYWPSLSGYYLPPGIYRAEKEDAGGVFFKAPSGMKLLSLTGSTPVKGGIYLPKQDTVGVRGYVYLKMPVFGGFSYLLPNAFFSHYGKTWKVQEQPNKTLEPTADGAVRSAARSTP